MKTPTPEKLSAEEILMEECGIPKDVSIHTLSLIKFSDAIRAIKRYSLQSTPPTPSVNKTEEQMEETYKTQDFGRINKENQRISDEQLLSDFDKAVTRKWNQLHDTFTGKIDAFFSGAGYGIVYADSINDKGSSHPSLPPTERSEDKLIEVANEIANSRTRLLHPFMGKQSRQDIIDESKRMENIESSLRKIIYTSHPTKQSEGGNKQ